MRTFRVEVIVPYVVDECETPEAAQEYGAYLAEQLLPAGIVFEVRVIEAS